MEQEQQNPAPKNQGFIEKFILFIRQQGVIGLAVAVILGGAVQKVVTALVNDIINPLVGIFLGKADTLREAAFTVGDTRILWGDFVSTIIDFLILALIIYLLVKVLNISTLDKPKQ